MAGLRGDKSTGYGWWDIRSLFSSAKAGDDSALSALVGALADAHPFSRWLAGKGLARSAAGLRRLRDVVTGSAPVVQAAAADAFVYASTADASVLLPMLSSPDALMRQSAVEVLLRKRHRQLASHLGQLLGDSSLWVRRAAAAAVGHLGERAHIPVLTALLRDESFLVRRSAAYALGALRAREAVESLLYVLNDNDPVVRRNAAWSLGRIGDRTALPSLKALSQDTALEGDVAAEAQRALASIEPLSRWKRTN
jgi:HEAT repeat protein